MLKRFETQAQYFKLLSHPTRLAILSLLRDGEACVCHMEAYLGLRQAHISQHLMILRDAQVVTDRRDGWNIYYRIAKPDIFQVIASMNIFTEESGLDLQTEFRQIKEQGICPCPKCNTGENISGEDAITIIPRQDVG